MEGRQTCLRSNSHPAPATFPGLRRATDSLSTAHRPTSLTINSGSMHTLFQQHLFGTNPEPSDSSNCGLTLADDSISERLCVTAVGLASSVELLKTLTATVKEIGGGHATHVDDTPVFTSSHASTALVKAREQKGETKTKFALKPKLMSTKAA